MALNEHDRIIIAGGGPTGLIAALSLAKQDIPVLLLEQQESPGARSSVITPGC